MVTCFLNNVYCCYLPAHTSHGLQPLDNGPFNALKLFYKQFLAQYNIVANSAPVDKLNFIRCLKAAREAAYKPSTIISSWRVTGNYPISRRKALAHDEINPDVEKRAWTPETRLAPDIPDDVEFTPTKSRQIKDMGIDKSPSTKYQFKKIAKGFEQQEMRILTLENEVASLKEQLERIQRGKKRRKLPNPNQDFRQIWEVMADGNEPPRVRQPILVAEESEEVGEESDDEDEDEEPDEAEVEEAIRSTRIGRVVKRPRRFEE